MKLCRFSDQTISEARYGVLEGEFVRPIIDGDIFNKDSHELGDKISLTEVKLLAPVAPSKIVCVGRNYREHAAEL